MTKNAGDPPPPRAIPPWAYLVEKGTFDRRIIHHTFWLDLDGEVQALEDLSTETLDHIVATLGRAAPWLYGCELIESVLELRIAHRHGRASREELLAKLGLPTIVDLSPDEWLETTALIRAIRRHLRDRA